MKKLLSGILCSAMLLSTAVPTFASEHTEITATNLFLSSEIADTSLSCEGNVDSIISLEEMTTAEVDFYYQLVEEEVSRISLEYGGNIDESWLRSEITKGLEGKNVTNDSSVGIMTKAGTWIPDINVANDVVASQINVAIGVAIGVGIGGLGAYVYKVGFSVAKVQICSALQKVFSSIGLNTRLQYSIYNKVDSIIKAGSPGMYVAVWLDQHDHKPSNGYVNYIL
ncbi:MAG: hypothetical protein R3Y63_14590 [Eubacteriales bacterium]